MTFKANAPGQWFVATIIDQNGVFHKKLVIGYGKDPEEMRERARGSAQLVAGTMDDSAHLPYGNHEVLHIETCKPPF